MLLAMALRERGSSTRIDVVFDNYREILIKNLEREKRGAEMGATYRSIRHAVEAIFVQHREQTAIDSLHC